jgi:hypothetical protein
MYRAIIRYHSQLTEWFRLINVSLTDEKNVCALFISFNIGQFNRTMTVSSTVRTKKGLDRYQFH